MKGIKHFVIYILSQKFTIFATVLLLILASCNPCKRLAKRCPPSDSIAYIETIDTVIITVPGSTESVEFPLGSLGLSHETESQAVEVVVKDSVVFIRTTCKEQEQVIYNLRKQLASQKTVIERVEIPTYVSKYSRYHTFSGIVMPILLLLIGAGVYLRIKKIV